jgi:RraA family protein
MAIGFRQYNNIRRADKALVELFRDMPTPNIDDNMNRMFSLRGLKPYNRTSLLGTAFTVRVPAGNNLMFNRAIDLAQPGDVIVVDGGGYMERALCGEIMMTYARTRGIAGFVVNGCIRDLAATQEMDDFSVYALGVNPNGPMKNGPGEINTPVVCGGMVIHPGDIIAGDIDGLVVIRPEDAAEVAEKAANQNAGEKKLLETIAAGTWDRSNFEVTLNNLGCEIID